MSHAVSQYERTHYYSGITNDDYHPHLLYRSDLLTNPFPIPQNKSGYIPYKSARGIHNTPLNDVWESVGPQIRNLLRDRNVRYSSINPARFVTYEGDTETLGPVVVWIGVHHDSTSSDTAHEVSQEILALLARNGVEGGVVEWCQAARWWQAGPPPMRVVDSHNNAAKERQADDAQGSLTLYFREGKDKHGNPSDKVLGVSNCHVLRKKTDVDYEFDGSGAPKQYVRVDGLRRFQQGPDDIKAAIRDHRILADLYAREIVRLEAKENPDGEEDARALRKTRENLVEQQEAITELEVQVKDQRADIEFRNVGHVRYAKAISVDVEGGTLYTEDWAAFEVDQAKVKPEFEGTVVDLGTAAIGPEKVTGGTAFKYPEGRMLKIQDVVTPEQLLASPDSFDSNGQPCLVVGKDGTQTGLTIGRYAGLVSFLCDERGVESTELAIYNWGKHAGPFSDKGDSGALVWDGRGRIVGQLHSGQSKDGSTSPYVTYATPAWWLLQRIRDKFPHAVFYHGAP